MINDFALTDQVEKDPVLRLFLDSLTDQAVFTIDPHGLISNWGEGCRRLKGYTSEEAIGQHFRMLYTLEEQALGLPESNLAHALSDGQFHVEAPRVRKGGLVYRAEISIYPIKEDGRLAGFAKIVKDVSQRYLLELERSALSEKLALANVALEGFCHSVAHDLRTPIRSIISKSRIVQEDFAPELPAAAQDHLSGLVKSGLRLNKLVDDLLDFARVGESDLKRRDINASAMGNRLAEEITNHSKKGTPHFTVQENMVANADPSMFEFILRNLFENSCKYSDSDPDVSLHQRTVNGETVFEVKDEGIGFDMKQAQRIFEPFQRLHSHDVYEGSGIGLANVKRIVERHGGRIWAESEPGKGASFQFTLQ